MSGKVNSCHQHGDENEDLDGEIEMWTQTLQQLLQIQLQTITRLIRKPNQQYIKRKGLRRGRHIKLNYLIPVNMYPVNDD